MESGEQCTDSEASPGTSEMSDVDKFDEMFANRYTPEDKQFMKVMALSASKPPLVYPWIQGNFRRGDNRQQKNSRNWNRERSRSPQNRYSRSSR